jgi:organic radical activating enzyme
MKLERHTASFCPTCYKEIPALITVSSGSAVMTKTCSVHGYTAAEVERDPVFYTHVLGQQSPAIYSGYFVDVTRKCNLRCEYCYYRLETVDPEGEFALPRILEDCAIHRKHAPFILTGGEPATRTDIAQVIREVKPIGPVVMLTNGVRLAQEEELYETVLSQLVDHEGVCRLNLSVHDKQTDKWRTLLEHARRDKLRLESLLIVVDSKERFLMALNLAKEFADVVVSFRIKGATNLWAETRAQQRIFVSDMLRWLEEAGESYQFIMPGHNKPTFVNVLCGGLWLMLVSWYDVTNVDLRDIDCPPYYRARNGEVVNLVTYGLINEGMEKGWLKGQRITPPK